MSNTSITKRKTLNGKAFAVAFLLVFSPELSFANNGHCPDPSYSIALPPSGYTKKTRVITGQPAPTGCPDMSAVPTPNSMCERVVTEPTLCVYDKVNVTELVGRYTSPPAVFVIINGIELWVQHCGLVESLPFTTSILTCRTVK